MAPEINPGPSPDLDRDNILQDFLRTLKVSFKNATIYNTEHPAFIGSVNNLKKNIDTIFKFLNPISLSLTPRSIFMDNRFWEGEKIYQELGRFFHFRKIKSLGIRPGISDLQEEDLADSLWEEIIIDDKFDSLSFSIFSKLIEKERHLEISTSLRDLFQSDDPVNRQPEVEEKIKALLSGTSSKFISEIYRQTLSNLLKEINFDQKLRFGHEQLNRNYRFVLLNTLEREANTGQMLVNLEKILEEWKEITSSQDFTFLQCLWEVLKLKEDILLSEELYKKSLLLISEFIEKTILDENTAPGLEYFLQNLPASIFDVNTYLEYIFTEEKISPFSMRAFFKFFANYFFYLNLNLEQKASNPAFLHKIVNILKSIDTPMSLVILKTIYPLGN